MSRRGKRDLGKHRFFSGKREDEPLVKGRGKKWQNVGGIQSVAEA